MNTIKIIIVILFIFSVSIVSAFWPFDWLYGKITGKAVASPSLSQAIEKGVFVKDVVLPNSINCNDSDNGIISKAKGNVSVRKAMSRLLGNKKYNIYSDYCTNSSTLLENYCDRGKRKFVKIKCEEGCEKGACKDISNQYLPIPSDYYCFLRSNSDKLECSKYWISDSRGKKDSACPKYFNPVYDLNETFYPTACWAEVLGVSNYTYGYSPKLLRFFSNLWAKQAGNSEMLYFSKMQVPKPEIGFVYHDDGLSPQNGVRFRSVVWENLTTYHSLDYIVYNDFGATNQPLLSGGVNLLPVINNKPKVLLAFVKFDDAYPDSILINWTNNYQSLINDYIAKKQRVEHPIQFQITPVVIYPPIGVSRLSIDKVYFTEEETQKMYETAVNKTDIKDFDVFAVSNIQISGFGGYFSWWNEKELIISPLAPPGYYSSTNKQEGLNSLAAFQQAMLVLSHEILHAVGLPGDHIPMGYGTTYLDHTGSNVDHITGKQKESSNLCEFIGISSDYYFLEIPNSLKILAGDEPLFLQKMESSTGNCLFGLYNNEMLKDYDMDEDYEIAYKNNLIGIELQRSLGWVDIDGDGIAELVDPQPYGGSIVNRKNPPPK